jgi:tRNA-specific 2-thiouridylase
MILHGTDDGDACGASKEAEDAHALAQALGFEHHTIDCREAFSHNVISPFVHSYESGATPNPCILCNRTMKFGRLLEYARSIGCEKIATGHYARVGYDSETGKYTLLRSKNEKKDQTYVLYFLTQDELSHILFPLGEFTSKDEVRAVVGAVREENATKKESQDICFIPDGDYATFIEEHTGKGYPEGDFIDLSGRVLGRHRGLIHYTVGQRKGLGIALGEPMYVKEKSIENGTVTLCRNEDLFSSSCLVSEVSFVSGEMPTEALRCTVKTRYSAKEVGATLSPPDENGTIKVTFDTPVRAVTRGQSAVFYSGEVVLGGGIIQ